MPLMHIVSEGDLPKDGQYVLAHLIDKPWLDGDDIEGQMFYKVVKFKQGLSVSDREKLPDSDERKRMYCDGDEHGNNRAPYEWSEFGPSTHFGQEVDYWFELPVEIESTSLSSTVKEKVLAWR